VQNNPRNRKSTQTTPRMVDCAQNARATPRDARDRGSCERPPAAPSPSHGPAHESWRPVGTLAADVISVSAGLSTDPVEEGHDPVRDVDGEPGTAVSLGRNPAFNTRPKINMTSPCPLIRPNRAKGRISGPRCHGLPKLSRSRPNRHGPFGQLKCGADVNRSVRRVVAAARISEAQAA
jgi:hypothetical protein